MASFGDGEQGHGPLSKVEVGMKGVETGCTRVGTGSKVGGGSYFN